MRALLLFEVKYYFKNLKELIQIAILFISIVVIYPFTVPATGFEYQSLAPSILWIALIMAILPGSSTLFQRDRKSGRLDYYQLTATPLEWVVFSKWLAFYGSIMLPIALALPLAGMLMHIPPQEWANHLTAIALSAIPLSLVAALASAVMVGLERTGAIMSLVILPLAIPIIIFGSSYIKGSSEEQQLSFFFLMGFSVFLLPVLCGAGSSCIRASN